MQADLGTATSPSCGPDRSLDVQFEATPEFVANPALADRIGAFAVLESSDALAHRFVLTYFPKTDEPSVSTLDQHVDRTTRELLEAVPGKAARPLQWSDERGLFRRAGLSYRAFAYPTVSTVEGSSICDAAAVMFASRDGFWTLSWNCNQGDLEDSKETLDRFLSHLQLRPVARQ